MWWLRRWKDSLGYSSQTHWLPAANLSLWPVLFWHTHRASLPCVTTIHHSAVCCLSHSVVLQVLYSQTLSSAHDFILLSWWWRALARWARERLIKNNFRNEQTTPARQFDWAPVIECLYSPTKSTGSAVLDFFFLSYCQRDGPGILSNEAHH